MALSFSTRSVEGPSTSLACATGVRTVIHAHTMSDGLVRLAGEGLEKGKKPISMAFFYFGSFSHRYKLFHYLPSRCTTLGLLFVREARSAEIILAHLPLSACYVACCLLLTGLWRACA